MRSECRLLNLLQRPIGEDIYGRGGCLGSAHKLSLGQNADHRGVVGAKAAPGQQEREPLTLAGSGEPLAEGAIAGHAAGGRDAANPETPGRADGLGHEHVHNGSLRAGAQIAHALRVIQQARMVAQEIATEVFSPLKLKLSLGSSIMGRGKS